MFEVVLVQFNLVDNHYQQNPNKSYTYLLSKGTSIAFDDITITLTDQRGRLLEVEVKV